MAFRYEYKLSEAGIKRGISGLSHQGKSYVIDPANPKAMLDFRFFSEEVPLKDPEAHGVCLVRTHKS